MALRALLPVLVLLAYRFSAGDLLTAGPERQEARFLAFHLMNGALFGLAVAWLRRPPRWLDQLGWLGAGLAGGALAECLEAWYSYRHLMGTLTVYAWQWFEWPMSTALVYQTLQGLRLLGLALVLLAWLWGSEKRWVPRVISVLLGLGALALRIPVRGAFLRWGALLQLQAWGAVAAYAGSCWLLLLALSLGETVLTPQRPNR